MGFGNSSLLFSPESNPDRKVVNYLFFSCRENSSIISRELEYQFSSKARKIESICSEIQSRYLQQGVDYSVRFFAKRGIDCLILCCASWYLPETLRVIVQDEILMKCRKRYGPDYEQKIVLLLKSKAHMLRYIQESNILGRNSNEVFGNILASKSKILITKTPKPKPKRIQRHRGYRDKGSRRIGFEFLQQEEIDFSLRELQNQIEAERESVEHSILFWEGFLD